MQPSYEEVTHVIKCLKNHKAPGTDQISAELLTLEEKLYGVESTILLTHCGPVTQICIFTLQLCKTDDANLRF